MTVDAAGLAQGGSDPQQGTWWTDPLGPWLDNGAAGAVRRPRRSVAPRLNVLAEAPGTYVFDN